MFGDDDAELDPDSISNHAVGQGTKGGIDIAGDYRWTSADGECEAILRLQPDGRWWHAAQRQHKMTVPGEWWHFSTYVEVEGTRVWEMAESSGTWAPAPIPCEDDDADPASHPFGPKGLIVLLTCENCRWKSDSPDDIPAQLRPATEDRAEVEEAIADNRLCLCYAVCWASRTRHRSLSLEAGLSTIGGTTDIWLVVEALGFARDYHHIREKPNHVGTRSVCASNSALEYIQGSMDGSC